MSSTSKVHRDTFKAGSTTYYTSSLFFPGTVRRDVSVLYGFVRTADDFVDRIPRDADGFHSFAERFRRALTGPESGDLIVDAFVSLLRRKNLDPSWVDAFLRSMEMDLTKREYRTLDESLDYIYGSAEVIGLLMAEVLGLDHACRPFAKMQGRAMQFINFIRDIAEDQQLGRTYLPLEGSGLNALSESEARANPAAFTAFISRQLERYNDWQRKAEQGYHYIPRRYRIPIRTAADAYDWTARQIARDPFVVFRRKVKPGRLRVLWTAMVNVATTWP